ncbi:hypothetical protein SAMN05421678_1191 [Actinopolymorpha cephalotaxi]|uniref:Drug/metabolite transporter (DMT)-like permease n=1 Tax=Actinopolymorpha cephalotaxi TaxID=504797 RepID=A0A1I3AE88_9ACTN|nr:hypothetical protein [Actinopolymorpha cephalotaxi]NYH82093.1 drug/metabolite transporter (DMT)-like permease [Actinopolymorpha cephalotaxi]SFH48417.1 hypothetical protein SAMN05421678_1191 [Actinopolymorpha cephalotaxi]
MNQPAGTDLPSREDLDAYDVLEHNDDDRLQIVRGRAEKWLGALSAFTGLIGTVLIIKGPESTSDLATPFKIAVAALITLALACLLFGTYRAYASAYGDPDRLNTIDPQPIVGLATRLAEARGKAAANVLKHLSQAVAAALAAVVLLAVAIGITWFAPSSGTASYKIMCLAFGNRTVAAIPGDTVAVKMLSPKLKVSTCP